MEEKMLTEEQYKTYYDFIINNISKMKQTYKYFSEYLSQGSIHHLIDLLSTWEFDDKWIKNCMSEKIKNIENKNEIRKEFYKNLISNINVEEQCLEKNLSGFYSIETEINYKLSNDKIIQKLEGRKIIINKDENSKVTITFFFVYHMLIVKGLIENKGIYITTDELKAEFNDNLNIIDLCKICTKDILLKETDITDNIEELCEEKELPIWFIENYIKYKIRQIA